MCHQRCRNVRNTTIPPPASKPVMVRMPMVTMSAGKMASISFTAQYSATAPARMLKHHAVRRFTHEPGPSAFMRPIAHELLRHRERCADPMDGFIRGAVDPGDFSGHCSLVPPASSVLGPFSPDELYRSKAAEVDNHQEGPEQQRSREGCERDADFGRHQRP